MEKKHSCQHNDNLQKRENTLKQILYFVHVQVCNVNKLFLFIFVSDCFDRDLFWRLEPEDRKYDGKETGTDE